MDLLEEMSEVGLAMDAFTYAHAIEACCNGGNRVRYVTFRCVLFFASLLLLLCMIRMCRHVHMFLAFSYAVEHTNRGPICEDGTIPSPRCFATGVCSWCPVAGDG